MENKGIPLTSDGYDKLQAEYRELLDVTRPAVIEQLVAARALGDLSENADYDTAKNKQAEVEGRIRELENIFSNAIIISEEEINNTSIKVVNFGHWVTILNLGNQKEVKFNIVGTHETNPLESKISYLSPLGEAVYGKKVGDQVVVKAPKSYEIKILKIEKN